MYCLVVEQATSSHNPSSLIDTQSWLPVAPPLLGALVFQKEVIKVVPSDQTNFPSVLRSVAPIQVFCPPAMLTANVCSSAVVIEAKSADCVQTQLVLAAFQVTVLVITL